MVNRGDFDEHESYLRRQALGLAIQFPENIEDSLRIIELLRLLVLRFLDPGVGPSLTIVPPPDDGSGGAPPSGMDTD
jgi:hypothetical protein